jgi:hypothetical protein
MRGISMAKIKDDERKCNKCGAVKKLKRFVNRSDGSYSSKTVCLKCNREMVTYYAKLARERERREAIIDAWTPKILAEMPMGGCATVAPGYLVPALFLGLEGAG